MQCRDQHVLHVSVGTCVMCVHVTKYMFVVDGTYCNVQVAQNTNGTACYPSMLHFINKVLEGTSCRSCPAAVGSPVRISLIHNTLSLIVHVELGTSFHNGAKTEGERHPGALVWKQRQEADWTKTHQGSFQNNYRRRGS